MNFHDTFQNLASDLYWNDFNEFFDSIDISCLKQRETPPIWRNHCHPDPYNGIGKDWSLASLLPIKEFLDEKSLLPEGFYFLTKFNALMQGSQPCHQDAGWQAVFTPGEWQALAISETKQIQNFFTEDIDPKIWKELPISEETTEIDKHFLVFKDNENFIIAEIPLTEEWGKLLQEIYTEYSKLERNIEHLPNFEEIVAYTWVNTEDSTLTSALSEELQDNALVNTAYAYAEYWKIINTKIKNNETNEFNFIAPSKKIMSFMDGFLSQEEKQSYIDNLASFAPVETWDEIENFFELKITKKEIKEIHKKKEEFYLSNSINIDGPYSFEQIIEGIQQKEIPQDALISSSQENFREIGKHEQFHHFFPKESIEDVINNIEKKDKKKRRGSSTFSVGSEQNSIPEFTEEDLNRYKQPEPIYKTPAEEILPKKEHLKKEHLKTEKIPESFNIQKLDISSPIPHVQLTENGKAILEEIERFEVPLMWSFSGRKDLNPELLQQQLMAEEANKK